MGMTFFITEPGWRMPVFNRDTPAFHVPHFDYWGFNKVLFGGV